MLPSTDLYEFEVAKGADVIVKEGLKLSPEEVLVITADTASDARVVNAVAQSAFAVGAKPVVIWVPTPRGVGKATDRELPVKALTAILKEADAWIELNKQYLLYSTTYQCATTENPKLRLYDLPGLNVDVLIRCFARVNLPLLREFYNEFTEMLHKTQHVRMTTPAGEDVEFDINPEWIGEPATGLADKPGSHMFPGHVSLTPVFGSVNGTIVFDGSILPDIGILDSPVKLKVDQDRISEITGGRQSVQFEDWLRSWGDPQMLKTAHASYGFNPGARISGQLGEDERVWGSSQWGLGPSGNGWFPRMGFQQLPM